MYAVNQANAKRKKPSLDAIEKTVPGQQEEEDTGYEHERPLEPHRIAGNDERRNESAEPEHEPDVERVRPDDVAEAEVGTVAQLSDDARHHLRQRRTDRHHREPDHRWGKPQSQ